MTKVSFEDGCMDDWFSIEGTLAEGTRDEMLAIANAIEEGEVASFKRCAVYPTPTADGGLGFHITSPRNSIRPVLVSNKEAHELAAQIRKRFAPDQMDEISARNLRIEELERIVVELENKLKAKGTHSQIPPGKMIGGGLVKLMEECGELTEVSAKRLACPQDEHWDGKGSLRARITDEVADVLACIDFVRDKWKLDDLVIDRRRASKLVKFRTWDLDGLPSSGDIS